MASTDQQCTRTTKQIHRCEAPPADWGWPDPDDPAPNPVACWMHLTAREREIALANRARHAEMLRQHAAAEGERPLRIPAVPVTEEACRVTALAASCPDRQAEIMAELTTIAAKQKTLAADAVALLRELAELSAGGHTG